jgi:hypothetical protein
MENSSHADVADVSWHYAHCNDWTSGLLDFRTSNPLLDFRTTMTVMTGLPDFCLPDFQPTSGLPDFCLPDFCLPDFQPTSSFFPIPNSSLPNVIIGREERLLRKREQR